MMNAKPQPNRRRYLEILSRMTPAQRCAKAFELFEMSKAMFLHGLRQRFPDATPDELHQIFLQQLARCHNRNDFKHSA